MKKILIITGSILILVCIAGILIMPNKETETEVKLGRAKDYNKSCVKIIEDGINLKETANKQLEQSYRIQGCIIELLKPVTSKKYIPEEVFENNIKITPNHIIRWYKQTLEDYGVETVVGIKKIKKKTMKEVDVDLIKNGYSLTSLSYKDIIKAIK